MAQKQANHGKIDGEILRGFVERLERLESQHVQINADMSSIYDEAKSAGYDPKFIIRLVMRLMKF